MIAHPLCEPVPCPWWAPIAAIAVGLILTAALGRC
jgi:hypothetical protein